MKRIRKSKGDWTQFLSGVPAKDYSFQDTPYEEQIKKAAEMIRTSDMVLIGAGAGASAAQDLRIVEKDLRIILWIL